MLMDPPPQRIHVGWILFQMKAAFKVLHTRQTPPRATHPTEKKQKKRAETTNGRHFEVAAFRSPSRIRMSRVAGASIMKTENLQQFGVGVRVRFSVRVRVAGASIMKTENLQQFGVGVRVRFSVRVRVAGASIMKTENLQQFGVGLSARKRRHEDTFEPPLNHLRHKHAHQVAPPTPVQVQDRAKLTWSFFVASPAWLCFGTRQNTLISSASPHGR
jgi:hypothetical protein